MKEKIVGLVTRVHRLGSKFFKRNPVLARAFVVLAVPAMLGMVFMSLVAAFGLLEAILGAIIGVILLMVSGMFLFMLNNALAAPANWIFFGKWEASYRDTVLDILMRYRDQKNGRSKKAERFY